ncbi:MAG: serine O-acetyltransferase [Hyphomicrobiales bacterium]|nr:serine O-acetyltransferase [Hyphomicrobiales bacterium]
MAQSRTNTRSKLETCDPVWQQVQSEAEALSGSEPALASFVYATILSQSRLEDSICHRLAQRLEHSDVDASLLRQTFKKQLRDKPELADAFRADLAAVFDRDPACNRLIEPILYYKGFHALQTHRFAHELWKEGRRDFAYYLQSQSSRIFGVDIHPAARVGRGIMIDHATGVVIGETAVVGDDASILHGVTLGGSGKDVGDRHPKIGRCVMIGAGAKILGSISVGDCARIASGSVVLKDVPVNTTVAGVPAKVVGKAGCPEPARSMEQQLGIASEQDGGA